MTGDNRVYTTKLGAGLGLIEETRTLLGMWQPQMDAASLYQTALHAGRFPNVSARRLRNMVVECFAPRYLSQSGSPAALLKKLEHAFSAQELNQLLFLYTCRANCILADFVRQVYWERYTAGHAAISNQDARAFVSQAVRDGKTQKLWSESMMHKVSSYLTGCCADYGLLESGRKSRRTIIPYRIEPRVAVCLAHDLHFSGLGDNQVIGHQDWALFGLERHDVRDALGRLSPQGHWIVQSAGEATRIGWHYTSMEACTDVLTQS